MYKAAIFDFDGTLCNTLPDLAAAGNYALSQLSFPTHAEAEYRYFVGEGVVRLMERILPQSARDDGTVSRLRSIYKAYYKAHIDVKTVPYSGVLQLLSALATKGVRTAVLSNKDDADTKKLTRHFFGESFDLVLGVREGKAKKPSPEVPLEIAAELGLVARELLFVGDSKFDIETARASGMDSCGVLWGFREREELSRAGATYIVSEPEEIEKLF